MAESRGLRIVEQGTFLVYVCACVGSVAAIFVVVVVIVVVGLVAYSCSCICRKL